MLEIGIGMGYVDAANAAPDTPLTIDVRGREKRARVVKRPIYKRGDGVVAEEPDGLRYHREHDWARIEDGEAVLGITWYAQDALGELVHFEAPEAGAGPSRTSRTARSSR